MLLGELINNRVLLCNKTLYEIAFLLPALWFPPLKLTEGFINLVLEDRGEQ